MHVDYGFMHSNQYWTYFKCSVTIKHTRTNANMRPSGIGTNDHRRSKINCCFSCSFFSSFTLHCLWQLFLFFLVVCHNYVWMLATPQRVSITTATFNESFRKAPSLPGAAVVNQAFWERFPPGQTTETVTDGLLTQRLALNLAPPSQVTTFP